MKSCSERRLLQKSMRNDPTKQLVVGSFHNTRHGLHHVFYDELPKKVLVGKKGR